MVIGIGKVCNTSVIACIGTFRNMRVSLGGCGGLRSGDIIELFLFGMLNVYWLVVKRKKKIDRIVGNSFTVAPPRKLLDGEDVLADGADGAAHLHVRQLE